jgi:hypothetical protein
MKFGDAYLSLSEEELNEKINEIQKSLDLCQNLGFRDFLYIPYCLCLISKYPYINELKTCLKCIYRILSQERLISYSNFEDGNCEINNLIMHIIHSVPIPDPKSKVKFFIPYYNRRLEIENEDHLLVIDKNTYGDIVDYNLEIEAKDNIDTANKRLKEYIEKFHLSLINQKYQGKATRAIMAAKENR